MKILAANNFKAPGEFAKDYRKGFDFLTDMIRDMACLRDWKFKEYVLPDGSIERWFDGDGETGVVTYRSWK